MVRSIIKAYLDFVAKNHKSTVGEFQTLLSEKSKQIEAQVVAKQTSLQELRERMGHLAISSEDESVEPIYSTGSAAK